MGARLHLSLPIDSLGLFKVFVHADCDYFLLLIEDLGVLEQPSFVVSVGLLCPGRAPLRRALRPAVGNGDCLGREPPSV